MYFELLDNLHTNLDNKIKNLRLRLRSDNRCKSANLTFTNFIETVLFRISSNSTYLFYLLLRNPSSRHYI